MYVHVLLHTYVLHYNIQIKSIERRRKNTRLIFVYSHSPPQHNKKLFRTQNVPLIKKKKTNTPTMNSEICIPTFFIDFCRFYNVCCV